MRLMRRQYSSAILYLNVFHAWYGGPIEDRHTRILKFLSPAADSSGAGPETTRFPGARQGASNIMLARLKLSTRILLTGTVVAIGVPIPLLMWLLPEQRATGYEMKAESTRYVVEAAWGVLDHYVKQVSASAMTLAQAQSAAKETLRHARYQGGNYVWITDLHPTMLMHPAKPEMEGQDLSSFRDPNGVALFV